ncbi:MAG: hypothetical protein DSO02_06320 [Hadesarchaea archaeon]|nr:MAG: hypothetical protein DSO02_06320 [Hadesarchaea archaeon]
MLPRLATLPPTSGMRSVVVLPTSTRRESGKSLATTSPLATQLEAATERGSDRTLLIPTNSPPRVRKRAFPFHTLHTSLASSFTPSSLVSNTSASSPVITTPTPSGPHLSSSLRRSPTFSLSFQRGR